MTQGGIYEMREARNFRPKSRNGGDGSRFDRKCQKLLTSIIPDIIAGKLNVAPASPGANVKNDTERLSNDMPQRRP